MSIKLPDLLDNLSPDLGIFNAGFLDGEYDRDAVLLSQFDAILYRAVDHLSATVQGVCNALSSVSHFFFVAYRLGWREFEY